ncbi:MAG: hypothetical protein ABSA11_17380 [Candidatus Bathyarchaeia archaeon]
MNPHIARPSQARALRCSNCGGNFWIHSQPDGTFKSKVRCPYCKSVLEVDFDGTEEDSSGP